MTIADYSTNVPGDLGELELQLQALKLIQAFSAKIGMALQRQAVFNMKGALVREPIVFTKTYLSGD